jgi:negative regulator of sigma-B (phosphoserine phosphatase)
MSGARRTNRPPAVDEPIGFTSETPRLSIAWITRPRSGEASSGDAVVVQERGDTVVVAVIDALGHGPKAASVARTACEWIEGSPFVAVADLVHGLHRALHGSRGAAALLLAVSPRGLEACSVGNVELRSATGRLPFVLTPGVLGLRLRQPRISGLPPLSERYVLFSDGISARFELKAHAALSAAELASYLFLHHRHVHDDATVLVLDVQA